MADDSTHYRVSLGCGCSFNEHRPARVVAPVDGEMRACGHPEHYPAQFPATYRRLTEAEFWQPREVPERPETA
jgi:hypothetical protein